MFPQALFRQLTTSQFVIDFMGSRSSVAAGIPDFLFHPNPYGGPCTIDAGSCSHSYTQVNQVGINLTTGGSYFSAGGMSGAQWALNLT